MSSTASLPILVRAHTAGSVDRSDRRTNQALRKNQPSSQKLSCFTPKRRLLNWRCTRVNFQTQPVGGIPQASQRPNLILQHNHHRHVLTCRSQHKHAHPLDFPIGYSPARPVTGCRTPATQSARVHLTRHVTLASSTSAPCCTASNRVNEAPIHPSCASLCSSRNPPPDRRAVHMRHQCRSL